MRVVTGEANRWPLKILETGVSAVTAGLAPGGWASGNPASLAASGSVTALFDLGQDWHQYSHVVISVASSGPSSGLTINRITGSDTSTENLRRPVRGADGAGFGAVSAVSVTTAAGALSGIVHPMGRYLFVTVTNADGANAQGATSGITIAAR
jgi:hypothetical protein